MRKADYLLPLGLALSAACFSTPEEETSTPAPEQDQLNAQLEDEDFLGGDWREASAPAAKPAQEGDGLGDAAQSYSLAEQKRRFLLEQHINTAQLLMDSLNFEEAEQELARALQLDPDNLGVKRMLSEVGSLQGKRTGEMESLPGQLRDRYELRNQQLLADAQDSYRKAELFLARGDYDAAIAELTITNNHIRWAPYSINWGGLDQEASELLARVKAERSSALDNQERESQQQAFEKLREQEEIERNNRALKIDSLLSQSIDAFDREDYEEAQSLANKVLQRDARNVKAQEVAEAAFRAGRQAVKENYIVEKRERFRVWNEYLKESTIPWTKTVTLADEDYWRNISERRADRSGEQVGKNTDPAEAALALSLTETRIPGLLVEEEEEIDAVVDLIRTYTGLPLVVDNAANEAAIDAGALFTYDLQNPLTVEQALNIITSDAGEEVTWTIRHEAVLITTREKARGALEIQNHDVQDLIFGLTDFLGPRIDRLRLLDDLEDEDGGGPFGAIGEKANLIEMSSLTALIQDNVAVGTWEDSGVSIDEGEGYVLVVHTPEVQGKVRNFLDDLRRFTSALVTIESKFLTIEDNYLQEIGVDFRGIDNPGLPFTDLDDVTNGLEDMASQGLDNLGSGSAGAGGSGAPSSGFFFDDGQDGDFKGRIENFFGDALGSALSNVGGATVQYTFLDDLEVSAILSLVEKSSQVQLVNDQLLSVHNTQRSYVSVINQRAYIQDFDVEVAQFQSIADPQVNVLTEGVVLDVRPTIHHDRKYLTLEIQPTVATVVALRPFSTTLGGGTQPVEFQLPELEVQSVFTSAVIPDGGSILLGGLSDVRNIERRAELPWLAKIPVVGFFFKQEGYNEEKKSLMILIRARISDVNESLDELEASIRENR